MNKKNINKYISGGLKIYLFTNAEGSNFSYENVEFFFNFQGPGNTFLLLLPVIILGELE